jgi:hypothetical protein
MALHAVPAPGHKHVGPFFIGNGDSVLSTEQPAVHPEKTCKLLGQWVVMVPGTQSSHELNAEKRIEMTTLTAPTHVSQGTGTMLFQKTPELCRNFFHGLIPGYPDKLVSDPFQRMGQAVVMMVMMGHVQTFPADVSLASGIVPVRHDFGYGVVFNKDLQPAILGTENTTGFMTVSHSSGTVLIRHIFTFDVVFYLTLHSYRFI